MCWWWPPGWFHRCSSTAAPANARNRWWISEINLLNLLFATTTTTARTMDQGRGWDSTNNANNKNWHCPVETGTINCFGGVINVFQPAKPTHSHRIAIYRARDPGKKMAIYRDSARRLSCIGIYSDNKTNKYNNSNDMYRMKWCKKLQAHKGRIYCDWRLWYLKLIFCTLFPVSQPILWPTLFVPGNDAAIGAPSNAHHHHSIYTHYRWVHSSTFIIESTQKAPKFTNNTLQVQIVFIEIGI